ncbi:MAG: hypothetical protein WBN31_02220 [Gammaproteobacteria bacterium]
MTHEVLAVVMPRQADGESGRPQALVRTAEGAFELSDIADGAALSNGVTHFAQGEPIIDPDTREVIGYEMQVVNG